MSRCDAEADFQDEPNPGRVPATAARRPAAVERAFSRIACVRIKPIVEPIPIRVVAWRDEAPTVSPPG